VAVAKLFGRAAADGAPVKATRVNDEERVVALVDLLVAGGMAPITAAGQLARLAKKHPEWAARTCRPDGKLTMGSTAVAAEMLELLGGDVNLAVARALPALFFPVSGQGEDGGAEAAGDVVA
jgi:hypothetical protein